MSLPSETAWVVKFAVCLGTYDPDPCNILKNQVVAGRAPGQGLVLPGHDFVEAKPPPLMKIVISTLGNEIGTGTLCQQQLFPN